MELLLIRGKDDGFQTLGELFSSSEKLCYVLELPWKDNQHNISCIPIGTYDVVKRYSKKFHNHFHILDVDNRSYILIHPSNYYSDLRGCMAVGDKLKDINNDGKLDVINSRKTLNKLLEKYDSFSLTIINNFI